MQCSSIQGIYDQLIRGVDLPSSLSLSLSLSLLSLSLYIYIYIYIYIYSSVVVCKASD